MALKIETLNAFLGFGDGEIRNEHYFSEGMNFLRRKPGPGWVMTKSVDNSTVTSIDPPQWFTEREESGSPWIYAVDEDGEIFSVQETLNNWSKVHTPSATSSHGQGLITDHSESQRILFLQDRYVGSYDGVVWYESWKDFGGPLPNTNWPRPADRYEDWVVMGGGSQVALLNVTDDSWNASAFTLPGGAVVCDLKAGKQGVLLGVNFENRGTLILWDCQADRSTAPWIWTGKIHSIAKYAGIWIVSAGKDLLITDGYRIIRKYPRFEKAISFPDSAPDYPSGMRVIEDTYLLIDSNRSLTSRKRRGIYILNLFTGLWEFCPISTGATYNVAVKALFSGTNYVWVSYSDSVKNYIGRVWQAAPTQSYFISPTIGGNNNKKKKAEALILSLNFLLRNYYVVSNPNCSIVAKLYNFRRQLWGYAQARANSSDLDEIEINGTASLYNKAEVGDEITVMEGNNAGQIRHITAIANQGAANELWTLDSDLPALTQANELISVMPFKKVGTKTITQAEILDNRLFIPIKRSLIGRKFLAKIVIGKGSNMPLQLNGLSLVYDELGI